MARSGPADTSNEISVQGSREAVHGRAGCWVARIVSLIPGIGATAYACVDTAAWAVRYGDVWDILRTAGTFSLLLVLPGLIGWRWHLAGGLIIMFESSLNILMIANSIATHDSYAYFELDPSYVLRAILPVWVTMFVGGFLHVVAWGSEKGRTKSKENRHGTTLCWTARILSLIVGLSAFCYPLVVRSGHDAEGFTFVWPLLLFLVPGILAWWWHLAGSMLLACLACLVVTQASSSHRDIGYLLGSWLPMVLAFCTGSLLHLMAGMREREGNRGPQQTSWSGHTDTS
jgi:hypothetical protein